MPAESKAKAGPVKEAIQARDASGLRAAIKAGPAGARHPRYIVSAAGHAFLQGIELLRKNGSDLNAMIRNYRPVHNLMQSHAREPGHDRPTTARLECLEWLLANGVDPGRMASWPLARGIVVAAFMGFEEYVKILKKGGARIDDFASAALGDARGVKKAPAADPGFAGARDGGVLTALQCACGSRMKNGAAMEVAKLPIEAGADAAAETKSYAHSADAIYFAASAKNRDLFALLLESGVDATKALTPALWNGNFELGGIALAHGRAVAGRQKPLLNHLICGGQIPPTLWLLDRGASPNVPRPEGWTAVHQAASSGNARMMAAVLKAGGAVARRDKKGNTPLALATAAGRRKLVDPMRQSA